MAQRRMFSKSITNSSQFLMMPQSSQNLYFHLGMNADDDGFCEHFTIMRMTDSKPDDLKILQAKKFISVFDDRVLVIIDWKENNYLRADRYTPSKYLEIYKSEIKMLSSGIPEVDTGKDRIGKDRIEEENTEHTHRFKKPTLEEVKSYNKERDNCIDASNFIDHYEANGWKVGGKSAMKDWRASIRTWEKTDKKTIAKRQDDIKYGKKEIVKERILTPEQIKAKELKLQEMKERMLNRKTY